MDDLQPFDWREFGRFGEAEVYVLSTGTLVEVLGNLSVSWWYRWRCTAVHYDLFKKQKETIVSAGQHVYYI